MHDTALNADIKKHVRLKNTNDNYTSAN